MKRQVVEIPIEVWEFSLQDAEQIAALHCETLRLMNENARLKAEVERLTALNEKIMATADVIDANNQRLTKAGNNLVFVVTEHPVAEPFVKAWFAAKEGKPQP
jgi:hypothetical protein